MAHKRNQLSSDRRLLACYLPIGDPAMPTAQANIYDECGVDIFEAGIPCADPYLDGEVIRNSMLRSLEQARPGKKVASELAQLRKRFPNKYLVAMGYGHLQSCIYGAENCCFVDGVLVVGCTGSQASPDYDSVELVSPAVDADDVRRAKNATGYVMLRTNFGKTGARASLSQDNMRRIERLHSAGVSVPILLGFGISKPEHASQAVAFGADGVVIGSACVTAARRGAGRLFEFLSATRRALDVA